MEAPEGAGGGISKERLMCPTQRAAMTGVTGSQRSQEHSPAFLLISPALGPGAEGPEEEAGSTEAEQGQKCQRATYMISLICEI